MFLRLNVRFMLVKRVCLVLWFKPFKIPFLLHAVYIGIMNGTRKPTFHDAGYHRLKYLGFDVRPRSLQSAPRACFGARTVVILQPGKTRPRKP